MMCNLEQSRNVLEVGILNAASLLQSETKQSNEDVHKCVEDIMCMPKCVHTYKHDCDCVWLGYVL